MWELDQKKDWAPKSWCFSTVVLEKILESPLDCSEIKPVNSKGNQSWIFIWKTDTEADTPVLWPADVKSWLIRENPDAWKDWRQEEKVGWHHWLDGHKFEQAPGDVEGQGRLPCCSPCVANSQIGLSNWTTKTITTVLWWFIRYINMNQPRVYICPPILIPLPTPSPFYPSRLFHSTGFGCLLHASNLHWSSILHMVIYIFQFYFLQSSHPHLLPQSPKVCSLHLCLFCCPACKIVVAIFLNSIYMH